MHGGEIDRTCSVDRSKEIDIASTLVFLLLASLGLINEQMPRRRTITNRARIWRHINDRCLWLSNWTQSLQAYMYEQSRFDACG